MSSRKRAFIKTLAFGLLSLLLIGGMWLFAGGQSSKEAENGRTNRQRIAFLAGFGWQVAEEPTETGSITIPLEFNDVYKQYNELQLEQGYDLRLYAGKTVTRYQYEVKNHPNSTENIRANLLVYEGHIIGGDICSLELGGFMTGFSKENGKNQSNSE